MAKAPERHTGGPAGPPAQGLMAVQRANWQASACKAEPQKPAQTTDDDEEEEEDAKPDQVDEEATHVVSKARIALACPTAASRVACARARVKTSGSLNGSPRR